MLALVAVGFLVYSSMGGDSPLPNEIKLVCVNTGRTYLIDRDEINTIPMTNPDTHEATLLPCVERDGRWYVDDHYRSVLEELKEVNHYVEPDTLAVRTGP